MDPSNRRSSRKHLGPRFVYFVLTTVIAVVMLLTALVVWLATVTGSIIFSTLIIGGFFAVLSFVIYQLSIRDALDEIREELETVYEVTRLVKTGYEWLSEKLFMLLKLHDQMREK